MNQGDLYIGKLPSLTMMTMSDFLTSTYFLTSYHILIYLPYSEAIASLLQLVVSCMDGSVSWMHVSLTVTS